MLDPASLPSSQASYLGPNRTGMGSTTVPFAKVLTRLVLIHASIIPETVDEDIERPRYVDHASLSTNGVYLGNEMEISPIDWLAAAETVERRRFEHHGSDPLKAHYKIVSRLAREYDSCAYDKRTSDTRYDPTILSQGLVAQAKWLI